jgi:Phage major capsid protein E
MPYQSLGSTRIVDKVLTRIAYGFRQSGFVGDLIFPLAPVTKRKGKIIVFGDEEFFLHEMSRAPGANIQEISSEYGSADYLLKQDAIAEKVPVENIEEASDLPIDLLKRATMMVMRRLALRLEFDRMSLAGNIASYPATNRAILAGAAQWSDPTSNPEVAIDNAVEAIQDGCGMAPNVGVISLKSFNALKRHPLVRDKYKYVNADSITKSMVAKAFNLSRLEISMAKYKLPSNPSVKLPVFNNSFWMGYVATTADSPLNYDPQPSPNSSIDNPSFGYTYQLENYPIIEQPWYDRTCNSWKVPGIAERMPTIAFSTAGYLFTNVAA